MVRTFGWVMVDLIDKTILLVLSANCRTTYQTIARNLDLTVNAVKKRIKKLISSGIITRFYLYPSLAMLDAEMLLAILRIDQQSRNDEFLDLLGSNDMVYAVSFLSNWDVLVFAEYIGGKGLADIGRFLRQSPGVQDVELHTLILERGSKCKITEMGLSVLQSLNEDPRMSISELSKRSKLSPRRVKLILDTFLGEGGSTPEFIIGRQSIGDYRTSMACFHFRLIWDLNAGGKTAYINKIRWDEGKGDMGKIVEWLRSEFSEDFWYGYASASEPVIFTVFVIDHIRDARHIAKKISEGPDIIEVRPLFGYPTKRFPGLRDVWLEEILKSPVDI
jgi:DNA-binding Lrp family transcriptional regulator